MIHDTAVTNRRRDFGQIWDLLTDTHTPAPIGSPPVVNGWSFCRFESWMVFSAPHDPLALDDRLRLWKTDQGDLVGLAIVESLGRDFHVITRPSFREIEPDIVAWVERHWPAEDGTWITYADADDPSRAAVLTKAGYHAEEPSELMHTYDLDALALTAGVPPGFSFSAASEDRDLLGRSRLVSLVFHPERDPGDAPPPVMHEKRSYDLTLDLVVHAPEGPLVAFAAGFINAVSGIAEVEPVGTHPAYRQRGLAKGVVTEVFRRLRERGVRWVHIASAPEPAVSNRLYQALRPVGQQRFVRWLRKPGASDR